MANCVDFRSRMASEDMYGIQYNDDEDDEDFDEDGLDGFSDFDDDEMPPCRSIGRQSISGGMDSRNGNEFRRQRSVSECVGQHFDVEDDNRLDFNMLVCLLFYHAVV